MQERNMPPFAPVLMQSTRAIGYSLEAAIADIIDNSIAAKAGKVQLSFFPVGDAYVSILDNGTGMDDAQMNIAMQYGSKSPTETRDSSDLGRYGLGKGYPFRKIPVLTLRAEWGSCLYPHRLSPVGADPWEVSQTLCNDERRRKPCRTSRKQS